MSVQKNVSLFIPRVFPNITAERITNLFERDIGKVRKVDIIKTEGKSTNRVFVHFEKWYDTKRAREFQTTVLNSDNVPARYIYDGLWYWLVLENKTVPPIVSFTAAAPAHKLPIAPCLQPPCLKKTIIAPVSTREEGQEQEPLNDEDYRRIDDYFGDQEEHDDEMMEWIAADYARTLECQRDYFIVEYQKMFNAYRYLYNAQIAPTPNADDGYVVQPVVDFV
jgi:hypothetical protein